MLRIHRLVSRPRCSKAPRGLFVLSWVTRIFTGTSISPSPLSRQRSSRYSFRAGRNLPDKEFRYLRTVIVTAAVHRGFDSQLAPLLLTFQQVGQRAGRRHPELRGLRGRPLRVEVGDEPHVEVGERGQVPEVLAADVPRTG